MRIHPIMSEFLVESMKRLGPEACWPYPSAPSSTGYAHYKLEGRETSAHREAYRVANGEPGALNVLHRCDNRPCANPNHLFLGTYRDNYQDAKRKDRHTRGERQASCRLSPAQIIAIRLDKRKHIEVAADYGMSFSTISKIRQRRLWRHIQ